MFHVVRILLMLQWHWDVHGELFQKYDFWNSTFIWLFSLRHFIELQNVLSSHDKAWSTWFMKALAFLKNANFLIGDFKDMIKLCQISFHNDIRFLCCVSHCRISFCSRIHNTVAEEWGAHFDNVWSTFMINGNCEDSRRVSASWSIL